MKNFRKVLALILVVATLFSFVAMASAKNAEEFGDYADVQNKLAVDVIAALGITVGDNGNYRPADPIDRDEVAAMVARLRNGGAFNPDYYVGADNVFADVKGQWSEGYVTYCAQLGIIAGRNASTFDPNGQVTVVEVAKMLLCVLGYDAAEQGYVANPNWKVSVIRDAEKMGILKGIPAVDAYEPATRDQVALMFFNALEARLVYGYVSENLVKMTNSLLTSLLPTLPDIANPNVSENSPYELAYNNAIISDVKLMDVVDVWNEPEVDCYGRPGTRWGVGTSWSKFYKDAPKAASTDGTNPFGTDAIVELYHNGKSVDPASAASLLGKGVLAERYGNRLVLIDTYFTTVLSVNPRTGKATLQEGAVVSGAGLAAGDVVALTTCDGSCIADHTKRQSTYGVLSHAHDGAFVHMNAYTVVAPETITVDETHYVNANAANSYVIGKDGKTYEYAKYMDHEATAVKTDARDNGQMAWTAKGKDKVVYRDAYGYIQLWKDPAPAAGDPDQVLYLLAGSNTAVMKDTYVDAALTPAYTYTADAMTMDAAEKNDITITADTYDVMLKDAVAEGVNAYNDGILAVVTAAGAIKTQATYAARNTYLDATKGELVNEKVPGTELNYHFDANTKFLVRTWDMATGAPTYTAVTGYKAMPEYLSKVIFDQKNYNTVQYLADGNYITNMFIDAFYAKAEAEYVYITDRVEEIGVDALGKLYHEISYYKAFINGAEAYVAYFYVGGQAFEPDWTGKALESNTLYRTVAKSINATYKNAPIYVVMTEAKEVVWAEANKYSDIVVKNGQIELYVGGALSDIYSAEYLADLTVYVVSGATDVVAGAYTGTDFVAKYQNDWFDVDTTVDVYGLGNPVNTLVLKIK